MNIVYITRKLDLFKNGVPRVGGSYSLQISVVPHSLLQGARGSLRLPVPSGSQGE
jgi:hypothetical protein